MKKIESCLAILFIASAFIFFSPVQSLIQAYEISWSVFHNDPEYFKKIQANPRQLVEEFCEAEFNGAQDVRLKVARFSVKRAPGEKNGSPENGETAGKIVNFYSDAVVVVDSYQVKDVSVSKDHADATVIYKQLANSDGIAGKKYMVDKNDRDVVKLELDYDGSKWWIKNPPLPRVSKWALIEYSERIISSMDDLIKKGKASDGQKKYYLNNRDIVIFLRSL